ncbi:hypothetical protein [Granulicella sp. S156]|uniref:hypothetical protein n=1 Tax=Granulicella sp. S156 TaxID=1747224 RepID=UPI00131BA80D|nr:hypothetical protein [Granulicella sp. S156]
MAKLSLLSDLAAGEAKLAEIEQNPKLAPRKMMPRVVEFMTKDADCTYAGSSLAYKPTKSS